MSVAAYARAPERAAHAKAKRPARRAANGLRVGASDDSFEREADRVVDAVMSGGRAEPQWSFARTSVGAPLRRKCSSEGSRGSHEGMCEACNEKAPVRTAAAPDSQEDVPEIVGEVLNSPGKPLDPGACKRFETRFGRSFGEVRVHDDAKAAQSARDLAALAYTSGRHIVFATGKYSPGTSAGDRLLAHEVAHVVQQSRSSDVASAGVIQRQSAKPAVEAPKSEFVGCSDDLQSDLRAKHGAARDQVKWAISTLANGLEKMGATEKANFQKYFDPSNSGGIDERFVRDVRENYLRIGRYMGSLTFDCDPASRTICGDSKKWCVGGRPMWTCFGNLHICVDNYTKMASEDRKTRGIIHESTHNALHTTDRAYSSEEKFKSLTPRGSGLLSFLSNIPIIGALFKLIPWNTDTINNPDSYAEYAMSNRGAAK